MNDTRRQGFSILGIGAAACIACCAGPILAFVGGLSVAGLASTLVIGTGGLIIAAVASAAFVVARRGAGATCQTSPSDPVAVAAPTRKVSP